MKLPFFKFFILLLLCCNQATGQSNVYDSIFFGGRWRTYMTHLPTGYSAAKKYPLVMAFHGGSPLGYQSIQFQSGLNQKSDTAQFILVYPEGIKAFGNRTWNAGGCCAPATSLNIDDVGFVNALLNKLFSTKPIDTVRVYATGFSNGALLCYRLANQLAGRFAAIAPVAGNVMYYPWNPSRPLPIISFHSYQDLNVKYFGGITTGSTGTYFPPQDSSLGVVAGQYQCKKRKDTLQHNTNTYDHFMYSNCSCNVVIEQYVSYDGEHSWPGGTASPGTTVSNKFSATYLMWRFFQNYTTACAGNASVKDLISKHQNLICYPNPATDKINIPVLNDRYSLLVYDETGKIVMKVTDLVNTTEISCKDLPTGFYFFVAKGEKMHYRGSFVKQ